MAPCPLALVPLLPLLPLVLGLAVEEVQLSRYHDHAALEAALASLAASHAWVERYSLGSSVQGRSLPVLRLATAAPRPALKPMVKLVANMHGNEVRQVTRAHTVPWSERDTL